jgi:hypothetical protein
MSNDCIDFNHKWNIYYHLPQDKSWTLSSYVPIIKGVDKIEQVNAINDAISDNIIKYCMLFVMKEGITPMWEDVKNRNGGCFSYKVISKDAPEVWRELLQLLCKNTLIGNQYHPRMELVNGITISPKKNFSIVKIWLADCSFQDPSCITVIPNLMKNGSMFRKHEPEF